jgi:hypothetical protein
VASRRAWLILAGLVLAMVCTYWPWFTHETAGFTMNAFDLAEWASLHPAVRSSSPPMLASFLLRAPQLALVFAFALAANRLVDPRVRWLLRGIAMLPLLRFLPPAEFFTSATGDPNYRQMALLAGLGIGLVMLSIPLHRMRTRWQDWLSSVVLLGGVVSGWWGLSRTRLLLDNFEIAVKTGPGIVGLTFVSAGVILLILGRSCGAGTGRVMLRREPVERRSG